MPPPYYLGPLRADTIELDGVVMLVEHMTTAADYTCDEDPRIRRGTTADFVAFVMGLDGELSPDDLAILPALNRWHGGKKK